MSSIKVTTAILVLTGAICASAAPAQVLEPCELAKLTASDAPTGGALFGNSISVDENLLAVGASLDSTAIMDGGAVYVFQRVGIDWIEEAKLLPSNLTGNMDQIGFSVSLDDGVIVAGGPQILPFGGGIGKAFVFRRFGGTWMEEQQLISSGSGPDDRFGYSVSIKNDRIAVGAPEDGSFAGRVYVFNFVDGTWIEEAVLTGSQVVKGDMFGLSVSLGDDLLLAGAPHDDEAGELAGTVYVFRREGATWIEEAKLIADDAQPGDGVGVSVSLHEDYALVGATGNDDLGFSAGSAYVFQRIGTSWSQRALLTSSDGIAGDLFGSSVSIHPDFLIIGAPQANPVGNSSGAAYLFQRDDLMWNEVAKLVASDASAGDAFGGSVAILEDTTLVGASANSSVYDVAFGGDCDGDALIDACEIRQQRTPDCNLNATPDQCDIDSGASQDSNGDGIPDECPLIPAVSQWGLVALAVGVVVAATARIRLPAAPSSR